MQMIRENQFDGRIQSDPHRHVADFLEISNLFQYGENQEEAVVLSTFPFSLFEEAKIWLNEVDEGTITSWNEMRKAFISRYFSPAKFKRLLNEIYSFHQLDHKTLVDAWLRIKGMLRTCYGHGLTKGTIILDAEGIFPYNIPKVLLKVAFSDDSQNIPKPKTIVSADGSNTNFDHTILVDKFEALARKIDSEFLNIRKELKEMQDGRRDNHASQIYMSDDTPIGDEREWIAIQTDTNERIKDQVVELEQKIDQGLRNHQAIIKNLEKQFEYLEKIQPTESLPRTINTKPRHDIVYKPPYIQNNNDKGDVKFIEEDAIIPIPTMPDPNPIKFNSPTVSPFLKDCTVHIPYANVKTFADDVLPNHIGDKELKSIDGIGNGVLKKTKIKKDDNDVPKEPNNELKLNEKAVPHNKDVYHYQWHPTEIPHLNRIIKES
ncbi:reverse transcriptase domain-containing protein [Tanacetum coccineum]